MKTVMQLKHTTLTALLLCCFTSILFAQYEGDQLFDDSYIHEIRITSEVSLSQLVSLHADNIFEPNSPYSLGQVIIDGIAMDSIGVRGKGGVTIFDEKTPLKIDFNRYSTAQRYDGLKKINLHSGYFDPSFMREIMSYHVLGTAGVKSSRISLVKVYYNDVYEGIYSIVEQVDDLFIDNRFASANGALYKTDIVEGTYEEGLAIRFEENNDLPYEDFETMVESMDNSNFHLTLPDILDIDQFSRYLAANIFLNCKDNIVDLRRNFYAYYDDRLEKYTFVPWDFNLAMFSGSVYDLVPASSPHFLVDKFLKNDVIRSQYLELYCKLKDTAFDEDRLQNKIDQYYDLLVNEVDADPVLDIESFEAEVAVVRAFISARNITLNNQLSTYINECPSNETPINNGDLVINEIMASNNDPELVDSNSESEDWIELHNNTNSNISLNGFFLSNDIDVLKHWQFPDDAVIEANGYLTIWADRDVDQEGLHTSFKLNKTKGDLYLSYDNGTIIDEVSFENQETNIALARVPNGTGSFTSQNETFAGDNGVVSTKNITSNFNLTISPNPSTSNTSIQIESTSFAGVSTLRLLDIYGQLLYKETIQIQKGMTNIPMNLSNLPAGAYTVQIVDNMNFIKNTSRLIVIK